MASYPPTGSAPGGPRGRRARRLAGQVEPCEKAPGDGSKKPSRALPGLPSAAPTASTGAVCRTGGAVGRSPARALRWRAREWSGVPGTTRPPTPVSPTATGTPPPTATTTWASRSRAHDHLDHERTRPDSQRPRFLPPRQGLTRSAGSSPRTRSWTAIHPHDEDPPLRLPSQASASAWGEPWFGPGELPAEWTAPMEVHCHPAPNGALARQPMALLAFGPGRGVLGMLAGAGRGSRGCCGGVWRWS